MLLIEGNEAVKTLVILHPFGLEAKDMALYVHFLKTLSSWNILLMMHVDMVKAMDIFGD